MGNLALKQSGIGTLLNGNKSYGIVTGTISGLRISNVVGAYFIDNCAALLPYSGCRVRFKDSGGKYFDCVMGLRGTGESLSETELVINGTFDSDTGWVKGANCTIAGGKLNVSGGSASITYQSTLGVTSGKLFKFTLDLTDYTSGGIFFYLNSAFGAECKSVSSYAEYMTFSSHVWRGVKTSNTPTTLSIDNLSMKQVLTPSNQGLLLQAAPTVDSGFLYNLASYTYQIWS